MARGIQKVDVSSPHLTPTPITEPGIRDVHPATPTTHRVALTTNWLHNDGGSGGLGRLGGGGRRRGRRGRSRRGIKRSVTCDARVV